MEEVKGKTGNTKETLKTSFLLKYHLWIMKTFADLLHADLQRSLDDLREII